jgi:hypothetical protein
MNRSVSKGELVDVASRSWVPEESRSAFVAAVDALPDAPIELAMEDVDQLARVYEIRWRSLREQGIDVPGLDDALELLMTRDYMEPLYVVPVITDDVSFTAFLHHQPLILLALVAAPASLSAPTPPPGVPS